MKYIYLFLNWTFGVLFLIIGLLLLFELFWAGLSLLAVAGLLIPGVRNFIHAKTNIKIPYNVRAFLVLVLLAASVVFSSQAGRESERQIAAQERKAAEERRARIIQENTDYFLANKEDILSSANEKFDEEDYESVISLLGKYTASGDQELRELHGKAQVNLKEMRRLGQVEALVKELESIPELAHDKQLVVYKQLAELEPGNDTYKTQTLYHSQILEEEKRAVRAAEARERQIKEQFSAWNGAHRNLERVIKESMNDPDSYKHDETRYADMGDHLIVQG